MLRTKSVFIFVFLYSHSYIKINAVPPEACFANFRWDDCGRPPQQVLYYWKPGSRCEVGTWRGCLPNINMFHDEYECVNTCIFTARAQPEDYHKLIKGIEEEIVEGENITETTEALNVTTSIADDNATTIEAGNVTSATVEVNATVADASNTTDAVETNNTTTVQTNDKVPERNETAPGEGKEGNTTDTNTTPQ